MSRSFHMYSLPVLGVLFLIIVAQFLAQKEKKKALQNRIHHKKTAEHVIKKHLIDIFYLKHTPILECSGTKIAQEALNQLVPMLGKATA